MVKKLRFQVITPFPQLILNYFDEGVVGQAVKAGLLQVDVCTPRDFTTDHHRTIDDRPYGGGDGMVLLTDPLLKALDSFKFRGRVVVLSAAGKIWNAEMAKAWSNEACVTLVCGRYGGIDQRFMTQAHAEEISVGDFVVSGGELPALIMIDSIARFLPGVLGHQESAEADSFNDFLLEAPLFTRPAETDGLMVPEVLLSGNHLKIAKWRHFISVLLTLQNRPDLWAQRIEKKGLEFCTRELKESVTALTGLSEAERALIGLRAWPR